ncbi:MAG: 2-dehydropantoate 2-reductase [Hydrogenophaga sp.]|nr:2-dehydropantoate 2-reductase [Hydrogenophaga sp.]
MKVCVFGAGAIGGVLAAYLARGGADVSIVARGAHLAAIRDKGLTVRAADETLQAPLRASADPAELGVQDVVLVTVKTPALPQVAEAIAPLLGPKTAVVFVMNGIPWWYFDRHGGTFDGHRIESLDPGGAVRRAIGIERTLGGVIYTASTVVEPGVVITEHRENRLVIGEPDNSSSDRAEALAAVLRAGGIGGEVTQDMRSMVWGKLVGNLSTAPLCMLSRLGMRDTLADPVVRAAALQLAQEAIAVAQALGCTIKVPAEATVERLAKMVHKPSILQDMELGRPMETVSLLTVPRELARLAGVATPTMDLVISLAVQAAGASAPPARS